MSMVVWAHHMFLSGMGTSLSTFFQVTTMIISIPSVILISSLVLTLWGGSIRFNTPMLFALAFLPMFGIGGLTGLPLGLAASDVTLHDTYYVVAHFHYLVAPGTVFALFAGIYHWYPRITGRVMNERLGQIHFWGSFMMMNAIFLPMFAIGLMGVNRRLYDAGASYALAQPTLPWQAHMTYGAIALGFFQIPFVVNLFRGGLGWLGSGQENHTLGVSGTGQKARLNPWDATTLEWADDLPDRGRDLSPIIPNGDFLDLTPIIPRPDTGTTAARLGMWLFLSSEAMFFGSLFSGYVMLRAGAIDWPAGFGGLPWLETVLLIGATAAFGPSRIRLMAANALGLAFVAVKILNDAVMIGEGQAPASNLMLASWFTLTGVHAFHVLAGAVFSGWLAGPAFRMAADRRDRWSARIEATRRYWLFVDLVWLIIVVGFYLI
jgi:heme/copper-type cytochrome/quinol oxidase subunit 3